MRYSIRFGYSDGAGWDQDAFPIDGDNTLADVFWQVYDRARDALELEADEAILVAVSVEQVPLGVFKLPFEDWRGLAPKTVEAFAALLATDWREALALLPEEALCTGTRVLLAIKQGAERQAPPLLERMSEHLLAALREAQEALWQAAEQDGDLGVQAPFWNEGGQGEHALESIRAVLEQAGKSL